MKKQNNKNPFDFEINVNRFYNELNRKNNRYLSWEHCYLFFKKELYKSDTKTDKDYDLAALNLAFYLASWGMYRGSSFLLQYDYKIHTNLIKELFENKELVDKLYGDINEIAWENIESAKNIIKKGFEKNTPSDTLITKILMGIFGCTPAFDRFFIDGLKIYKNNDSNFNCRYKFCDKTYNCLKFYIKNNISEYKLKLDSSEKYPPMKLVDMFFWQIGFSNSFKAVIIDESKITLLKHKRNQDRKTKGYFNLTKENKDSIENNLEQIEWENLPITCKDEDIDEYWMRYFLKKFLGLDD